MIEHTILWRRLDRVGHESARLIRLDTGWTLEGYTAFAHGHEPCGLYYKIACDETWRTRAAHVTGWVGRRPIAVSLQVDIYGNWTINDVPAAEIAGCIDVDLNFSPSTNLLPIRRCALAPGAHADVRAAWLRFPSFTVEPLEQRYYRLDDHTYRYVSGGGQFTADLTVDGEGMVTRYPKFFEAEPVTP